MKKTYYFSLSEFMLKVLYEFANISQSYAEAWDAFVMQYRETRKLVRGPLACQTSALERKSDINKRLLQEITELRTPTKTY